MMAFTPDLDLVRTSLPALGRGLLTTLSLWLPALGLGTGAGLGLALLRRGAGRVGAGACDAVVELFRSVPVLVLLVWLYYALPVLAGVQMSAYAAALSGLTLNTMAFCGEIFRAGLEALPRGQWEGARALGMRKGVMLRRIVWPQVLRAVLPALTNRAIELAKVTSLASMLSLHDLMYEGRLFASVYYRPIEMMTTVGILYCIMIAPLSALSAWAEHRFGRALVRAGG